MAPVTSAAHAATATLTFTQNLPYPTASGTELLPRTTTAVFTTTKSDLVHEWAKRSAELSLPLSPGALAGLMIGLLAFAFVMVLIWRSGWGLKRLSMKSRKERQQRRHQYQGQWSGRTQPLPRQYESTRQPRSDEAYGMVSLEPPRPARMKSTKSPWLRDECFYDTSRGPDMYGNTARLNEPWQLEHQPSSWI